MESLKCSSNNVSKENISGFVFLFKRDVDRFLSRINK